MAESSKRGDVKSSNGEVVKTIDLKKTITLLNGVTIIVGSMIGSGIFISPTGVYLKTGSSASSILIWLLCGIYTMIGAYCYAELGCLIKRSAGDYAYVYEAFGPLVAFIRMWIDVIVTRPCNVAIISLTFAQYVLEPIYYMCNQPPIARQLLAAACILIITFVNCWSVKASTRVQDICTYAKVSALIIIIMTGIVKLGMGYTINWESPFEGTTTNAGDMTMAFYTGLFAYTGWSYLNCMVEEMKDPVKDMPRAIFISCGLVTLIYVLANVSYFTILSKSEIFESNALAVRVGYQMYGVMWWIIPLFVALSTFGGVNGTILTTSRIFLVAAQIDQMPKCLAMINTKFSTPIPSVLFVAIVSLGYLLFPDIFTLMNYVGFVTWLTFGLAVLSLIYFRIKWKKVERPIRVNIVFPIIYLAVTVFLIIFAFIGGPFESMMGTLIMMSAIPVYWICVLWKRKPKPFNRMLESINIGVQKMFLVILPAMPEKAM
uniref:Slc7a-9 n=1 Tax=Schmidtea mediterranea TaxID=79327 RepID=A0A0H3YK32_SCHMD|nr:slc7a-9 [Schmidtea mediterranea]